MIIQPDTDNKSRRIRGCYFSLYPGLGRKVIETVSTTINAKEIQTKQGRSKYQFLGVNRYRLLIPTIIAAVVVGSIILLLSGSVMHQANHRDTQM